MDKKLTPKEQLFLNQLGKRISDLRNEKKMSQEDLAEILGTHHNQFSRWENGKVNPKITTLLKVAESLNVSVGELLTM